jgi:hypothetical protein
MREEASLFLNRGLSSESGLPGSMVSMIDRRHPSERASEHRLEAAGRLHTGRSPGAEYFRAGLVKHVCVVDSSGRREPQGSTTLEAAR